MLFELSYPIEEQPQDAWQEFFESLDDTRIWKGHIKINKISEISNEKDGTIEYIRESILAFRHRKQIEKIIKDKSNLSIKFEYGKGPIKGYQVFSFEYGSLRISGDISLRGIYFPFTRFGLKHILEGEINALDRIFKSITDIENGEEAQKFGKH